ncbi:hypothetical protein HMI54_004054 [Coelomomyces lativittatus]|nr:hypothetical protein HMI54_004054 [Coelomomyces lativittatus]KAJ1513159.1 hypothetical protein HMI56_002945 [Coelomomyces lativittatus]
MLFTSIPTLHLDADVNTEEVKDPKEILSQQCAQLSSCKKLQSAIDECAKRVEEGAHETCVEEFFKFQKCVDHCLQPKLFKHLK